MITLSSKIEFVKALREKFLGNNLKCIEILAVVECTIDFGVVVNIDVADDKVSVWSEEGNVFWINLDDVIGVNYNPFEEDVCLSLEAKNDVKVLFYVD
ncbi:hypothetical protein [Desulfosporosinus meridiei]|uniref:Uncharacterized protein n=1 Tax=Desulfosporosinus meridiei (strain ATCC BAA-275 / DSM 13257 / KCTC 12902 / NCIMB 13706 / S10) TaxID=768704 RepID=J7J3F6_DESMD|nr:hypothetical protein [Desulfosporosinus meridiei]AFQ45788.1 hypothetical protein Desmer_3953 [Desulfosporosinus meridiei DSM 13257]